MFWTFNICIYVKKYCVTFSLLRFKLGVRRQIPSDSVYSGAQRMRHKQHVAAITITVMLFIISLHWMRNYGMTDWRFWLIVELLSRRCFSLQQCSCWWPVDYPLQTILPSLILSVYYQGLYLMIIQLRFVSLAPTYICLCSPIFFNFLCVFIALWLVRMSYEEINHCTWYVLHIDWLCAQMLCFIDF